MGDFDDAVRLRDEGSTSLWAVPDGWQQGRGAWGGLVVAACLQAVLSRESADRSIRSITVQMAGPVLVGDQRIEVQQVRRGSAMTTWNVDVVDPEGLIVVHASVITGAGRDVDHAAQRTWGRARMGEAPHWTRVPEQPIGPPQGPAFAPHLSFRPFAGIPATGSDASTRGWVSFTDGQPWTAPRVLGIIDAWWPGALAASERMRPMATVMFAATLVTDPRELDPDQPLFYEGDLSASDQGFTSELRRLWSPEGQLVAENLQSIVIIA